ncbi:ABC transporter permease [Clostridium estertheticum]|uniref:ABC transporter permease n=1 Tax=Clostridium estertheticum TaxID=238834 RepID=UPI001CD0E798|nr:ABC transporter permease [Clostridium estertheticum]MBZ9685595.1 ABC transporter permease [Clostridium estertheticum]
MKNNIKKFIPQILAVMLGVFLVYFVCILGGGIKFGIKDNIVTPLEKLSLVWITDTKVEQGKFYKEMSQDKDVEKIIFTEDVRQIQTKLIAQSAGTFVFYPEAVDIKFIMDKLNFKLVQGKIPENNNELCINSNFAKSNNLNLGDSYGSDVDEKHQLNGIYKIVGIYSGKFTVTFCSRDFAEVKKNNSGQAFLVIPKEGKLDKVNSKIELYKNIKYENLNTMKKSTDGLFQMFNIFAVIVLGLTVFVITFTISNINYMHLYDRLEELSILDTLGYNKITIAFKLIKEFTIIIFLGSLLGIVLGILGGYIFNAIYCTPKGFPVGILNPWYILISLLVPVFVSLFSSIPVIRFLRNMNTIEVLEGRY